MAEEMSAEDRLRSEAAALLERGDIPAAAEKARQGLDVIHEGGKTPHPLEIPCYRIVGRDDLAASVTTLGYEPLNTAEAGEGARHDEAHLARFEDVELSLSGNNVVRGDDCYTPHVFPDRYVDSHRRSRLFARYGDRGLFFMPGEVSHADLTAIDVTHLWSWNWFHFLLDVCGTFASPLLGEIPTDTPVLCDRLARRPPFRNVLSFFAGERPLWPSGRWQRVHCKELWQPSPGWRYAPYYEPRRYGMPAPDPVPQHQHRSHVPIPEHAARMYQNAWPDRPPRHTRMFLSRRNVDQSRCVNEQEIEDLLIERGFEAVSPEDFGFRKQAAVFYDADVVVGTSGGAFANLVFCRPGTRVICFRDAATESITFAQLGAAFGLDFTYVDGTTVEKTAFRDLSTFSMNPQDVLDALP
jgi:hypothetical protein